MIAGLEAVEPGAGSRYLRFLSVAERLTRRARPGLIERRFDGVRDIARPSVLTTLLGVKPWSSVASLVSAHFRSSEVRQAFSFQTLYLGTAPSRTPAAYVMIPLVEATLGVWYPMGGVWQIARAVARLATDLGVEIRLLTPVDAILTRGDRVVGVRDQSGASEHADVVVANADWGYTQSRLLASGEGVARREYGCSGVLFLLAVRGPLSGPHHAFILSPAFDRNLEDIFERRCLPELPSVCVSRPTATDPTLAPPGIELIYVLVPCPTLASGIDWGGEIRGFRKRVLDRLTRIGWEDLEERIVAETSLTPETFGARYNLAEGSAFGLAATLVQSGPFRPTVRSRRYRGLYHAGASSHPGGGVPIVTLAGRLAAEAVLADLGRAAGSRRSVAVSRAASPGGGQRLP
jgi:phytoene desaturase